MKRDYELVVVLNPALEQGENTSARERIKELITKDGGEITAEEEWGTRRLAYSVRKTGHSYLEGAYYLTHFNADRAAVKELEGHLRLSEQVLRHLLVKGGPPKKKEEPAPAAAAEIPEPIAAEEGAPEKEQE